MPHAFRAFNFEKKDKIRIGLIAVGYLGQVHFEEMLKRSDVEVLAMADPDKKMMAMAQGLVKQYGQAVACRIYQW